MAAHERHEVVGHLRTLARALARRRRVSMRYRDGEGQTTEREVDALALSWRGDRWLLAAWCHRRHAFRLFRVERIARSRMLARPSDGAAPAGFDPRFFASVGFLESGGDAPVLCTLRLSAPLGGLASAFFPGALFERPSERTTLCHLRATDLLSLASLSLSLGKGAELVHPAAAREIVDALRTTRRR